MFISLFFFFVKCLKIGNFNFVFLFSLIASQSSLLGIPKKLRNVPRVSFCPKVELCGPHFSYKLNVQYKLPRNVIVRSEITAAGSAGDGYSIIPGLY